MAIWILVFGIVLYTSIVLGIIMRLNCGWCSSFGARHLYADMTVHGIIDDWDGL